MKELKRWLEFRWTWILVAALVILFVLSLSTPEGLSDEGHRALALLAGIVVLFVAEPISLPGIILFIAIYQILLGLGTPNQVARSFMHDAVFFIMGALMMGVALTKQALGKRLMLVLIDRVGSSTRRISLAIITTSTLLAGFIADHVVAAVFTPMVLSLVRTTREELEAPTKNLSKLLLFSVAYGASIGGLYAPSGGGRNIIMLGLLEQIHGVHIGFGQWVVRAFPISLLLIPVTGLVLNVVFTPETPDLERAVAGLREELEERELTGEAAATLIIFAVVVILWVTVGTSIGLGVIALIGAVAYLVFGVAEWDDYQQEVNWGVILIYMGALSLGSLLNRTGAAAWIARTVLTFVRDGLGLSGFLPIAGASSLLTVSMTNLMSASGAASVIGPITLEMSEMASINPVVMAMLTAISSAFGFLLLLATPPNAIIYSSGRVGPKDFLVSGSLLTVASLGVLFLVVFIWWNLLGVI